MDWGKKKKVIWTCFIVASLVTLFGTAMPNTLLRLGIAMLAAIMLYCLIDSK
jgi:hypothetical protein